MKKRPNPAKVHHTIKRARSPDNIRSSVLVRGRSTQFVANPCRWPQRPCPEMSLHFCNFCGLFSLPLRKNNDFSRGPKVFGCVWHDFTHNMCLYIQIPKRCFVIPFFLSTAFNTYKVVEMYLNSQKLQSPNSLLTFATIHTQFVFDSTQ